MRQMADMWLILVPARLGTAIEHLVDKAPLREFRDMNHVLRSLSSWGVTSLLGTAAVDRLWISRRNYGETGCILYIGWRTQQTTPGATAEEQAQMLSTDWTQYIVKRHKHEGLADIMIEVGARHVAKDIVGKGIANPMALLLATSMMLRHLSMHTFADRLEEAGIAVVASNDPSILTPDIGGTSRTKSFTDAVIKTLKP